MWISINQSYIKYKNVNSHQVHLIQKKLQINIKNFLELMYMHIFQTFQIFAQEIAFANSILLTLIKTQKLCKGSLCKLINKKYLFPILDTLIKSNCTY